MIPACLSLLALITTMGTGSPASSSVHLVLYAYFILSLFLGAPLYAAAAAAEEAPFSFSFDFSKPSTYRVDDLSFEGSSGIHGKLVDLTTNSFSQSINACGGRMSYAHPVPFYDNKTGEVASFSTDFTFAILLDNQTTNNKGDGLAFFLSHYPSAMPPNSLGGNLGLIEGDGTSVAYGDRRFIAVEFDTYNNSGWDPSDSYDHIGIDINSVKSVNTTSLPSFSLKGSMTASVVFDNATRMLVASLVLQQDGTTTSPLSYQVSKQLPDPVSSLLPPDVAVGFSATTGLAAELHQILSWSFNSSLARQSGKVIISQTKKSAPSIVTQVSIGAAVVSVLVLWCVTSCFRWKSRRKTFAMRTGEPRLFEYRELAAATNNFSEEKKLGVGGFGAVYRGKNLRDLDCDVAVKKMLNTTVSGNVDSFFAELNTINRANHGNLVELKGWCCRANSLNILNFMCWCIRKKDELFLVYEFMPNGSLDEHLQKSEPLPWKTRYGIVKGISSALHYLHEGCRPYILHRDIKPSNILLDHDFTAKLADFGLSRTAKVGNKTILTTAVGTYQYLDPQCVRDGKVRFNRSTDVYSFGLVLLEIACAKMTRDRVWELYRCNRLVLAADEKLYGDFDECQLKRVIVLGLWCSFSEERHRPSMGEVMDVLDHDKPLPDLTSIDTLLSTAQDGTRPSGKTSEQTPILFAGRSSTD